MYGMRRLVSFTSLVLLVAVAALPSAELPSPGILAAPWQQKALPNTFGPRGLRRTFPTLSNGYLLSYARTVESGKSHSIFLTALNSGKETVLPFWLPAAASIRLEAGTVNARGEVLLAGTYTLARANVRSNVEVNFISRLDQRGRVLSTTNLGDYTAERICTTNNGSLWTLGQVWPLENKLSSPQEQSSYALLREYNAAGTLKRSFLPRSALPSGEVLNYRARVPGANWAFLRCGDASVAAYVGRKTGFYLWTEVNTATGQTTSLSVRNPSGGTMTGLALLGEHTAYASFRPGGLYQLQSAPSRPARWIPVPVNASDAAGAAAAKESRAALLLGRDGPNLVHLNGPQAPRQHPVLYWSTPSR